jgi:hypothetical protein
MNVATRVSYHDKGIIVVILSDDQCQFVLNFLECNCQERELLEQGGGSYDPTQVAGTKFSPP